MKYLLVVVPDIMITPLDYFRTQNITFGVYP